MKSRILALGLATLATLTSVAHAPETPIPNYCPKDPAITIAFSDVKEDVQVSISDPLEKAIEAIGGDPSLAPAIRETAESAGLDPFLVAALITVESEWDAQVRGASGEYGLMQVMPETAAWAAENLGLDDFDPLHPETNIQLGTWYLEQMHNLFDDTHTALRAYNGGPGGIDLHVTALYADKVLRTLEQMKEVQHKG